DRVLREMPRMTLGGIAAPVHDEVRAIAYLSESARDLAAQLGGYLSGAVSKRGVAVDHTSNQLGEGHRLALRLAGDVAEAVHERHVRRVEILRRRVNRIVERCRAAVDERVRIEPLGRVIFEPRLTEAARVLRLDDALAFGVQFDVVAHAAAEGACGVGN